MDNSLGRALTIGIFLAVGGIGLFLFLYFVIFTGAGSLVRLVASLCIPPVAMMVLLGGYYILTGDDTDIQENSEADED